jgi:NADH:ubiquinone oxidoreductase subunit H
VHVPDDTTLHTEFAAITADHSKHTSMAAIADKIQTISYEVKVVFLFVVNFVLFSGVNLTHMCLSGVESGQE